MKVKKLIEQLKKFDQEMEAILWEKDADYDDIIVAENKYFVKREEIEKSSISNTFFDHELSDDDEYVEIVLIY